MEATVKTFYARTLPEQDSNATSWMQGLLVLLDVIGQAFGSQTPVIDTASITTPLEAIEKFHAYLIEAEEHRSDFIMTKQFEKVLQFCKTDALLSVPYLPIDDPSFTETIQGKQFQIRHGFYIMGSATKRRIRWKRFDSADGPLISCR